MGLIFFIMMEEASVGVQDRNIVDALKVIMRSILRLKRSIYISQRRAYFIFVGSSSLESWRRAPSEWRLSVALEGRLLKHILITHPLVESVGELGYLTAQFSRRLL
mmetsp:Transcript_29554/g.45045  ORF Transcript_29554/g.45045 Transcript_29554/m.45045 type:complete len:106 (-) Transcript_29554:1416-1733(-)